MKKAVGSVTTGHWIEHASIVNSKGLYGTIPTYNKGRNLRLKQTVYRIRDLFESGDTDTLRWVQVKASIVDAVTERTLEIHWLLNRIKTSGVVCLPVHRSFELNSSSCT